MKKIKLTKKIKKGKKIILLMPIIISILLVVTKVYAGTQDSNLVRNQVEGVYAVAPLSDKTHLYNLEIAKLVKQDIAPKSAIFSLTVFSPSIYSPSMTSYLL